MARGADSASLLPFVPLKAVCGSSSSHSLLEASSSIPGPALNLLDQRGTVGNPWLFDE